jgi:hypothetical protein
MNRLVVRYLDKLMLLPRIIFQNLSIESHQIVGHNNAAKEFLHAIMKMLTSGAMQR